MNSHPSAGSVASKTSPRRPLLLAVIAFVLGAVLAVVWFQKHLPRETGGPLSASTRQLLAQLDVPVSIRYYAILPAGSADEPVQAFAGRVAALLDAVQTAGNGKIQLVVLDTPAETNTAAATADGIQPFNLDKGDACFLGLTIASGKHHEAFARLQPEWEPALEFDLARAIQRVAAAAAPAPPAPEVARPDPRMIAGIQRLIPDVNAVSVEQADQIFHAEFLKQCGEIGTEADVQIKAAQQKVSEAEASGSPADLEAAQKNLARVQLDQAEKIKNLAADLETELAVFQRMKSGATGAK